MCSTWRRSSTGFGWYCCGCHQQIKKKKEEGIVEEGLEFADDTPYINEDEEKAAEQK